MHPTMLLDACRVVATRLTMRAANFVVFLILARSLTPAEFGAYGYIVASVLMLSVIADLGLRQATAAAIGEGRDEARLLAQLVLIWLVLGSVAVLAMHLAIQLVGLLDDTALLWTAALVAAPALFMRTWQGIFLGRGQIAALNRSELASRAVLLLGTAVLAAGGWLALQTIVWLLLLSYLVGSLVVLTDVAPRLAAADFRAPAIAIGLLRRGLGFAAGIIAMIMLGRVGVWIVGGLLSADDLGRYFGLMRLAEMVAEIATAVGMVIFSHGVRRTGERAAAVADTLRLTRLVGALMALVSVVILALAEPLLALALGPAYAGAADAFRLMVVGALAGCYGMMLFPGLSSQGEEKLGALIFVVGTATAALLAFVLTARHGLTGAALAMALAQGVTLVGFLLAYRRAFGVAIQDALLPRAEDFRLLAAPLMAGLRRRLAGT
ncbi:MAG: oligosaccharide flippase family protein [Geminicoccaceae bacterium]